MYEQLVMNLTKHTAKLVNEYFLFNSNDLQMLAGFNHDVKKYFCKEHIALRTEILNYSNS